MSAEHSLEAFEDVYWQTRKLGIQRRHLAALKLVCREPVLDLGCGNGVFLQLLHQRGFTRLVGLDISKVAIEQAKTRCQGASIQFRQFNFELQRLSFPDKSFGTVTMVDMLEHLYQPDKLMQEIHRVADEVVIVVPNFNALTARIAVLLGRIPPQNRVKRGHIYWVNYEELHDLLHRNYFRMLEEDCYIYKMNRPYIGRWIYVIGRLRPSLFATSFAVRAQAL